MTCRLVFAPEAEHQLIALYQYIAEAASPAIAERYINGILKTCESLQTFPRRGIARDDIRPGLRITHHNKRTMIAYAVDEALVSVIDVFHGGRDYEAILGERGDKHRSG